MDKIIRGIYIQVLEINEYTYNMKTSDGRNYIALMNRYGHWWLYEGEDADTVIGLVENGSLIHCGFGYTLEMCIKSIPTIQIKAWFGDWKWVNDNKAEQFVRTLCEGMNCSKANKIKALEKHIKGERPSVLYRRVSYKW